MTSVHSREELERLLEVEAKSVGRVWLGQMVDGLWQIRRRVVDEAIESVLASLVSCGAVRPMAQTRAQAARRLGRRHRPDHHPYPNSPR